MRGLKLLRRNDELLSEQVAPHVGAWIEIFVRGYLRVGYGVAPHVGAWIEIRVYIGQFGYKMSHPTWVRGLKFRNSA